jgi:hypothetical protein
MDHKESVIHPDFLSRNQQVVLCEMVAHTQQQIPHKD